MGSFASVFQIEELLEFGIAPDIQSNIEYGSEQEMDTSVHSSYLSKMHSRRLRYHIPTHTRHEILDAHPKKYDEELVTILKAYRFPYRQEIGGSNPEYLLEDEDETDLIRMTKNSSKIDYTKEIFCQLYGVEQ
jgi:hypothetical protein